MEYTEQALVDAIEVNREVSRVANIVRGVIMYFKLVKVEHDIVYCKTVCGTVSCQYPLLYLAATEREILVSENSRKVKEKIKNLEQQLAELQAKLV